jgi:hypothetical protein
MPDKAQEAYAKQVAYLEYCLTVLDGTAIASGDLTFFTDVPQPRQRVFVKGCDT